MAVNKSMPILVVDDFRMMRRVVKNLLSQLGFSNLDEASNGEEALWMLRSRGYDLVISDWNMEPMSGLELLKQIRSTEEIKDIEFLMLTAEAKPENIVKAKQEGVDCYIIKPFTAKMLKDKLESLLGPF